MLIPEVLVTFYSFWVTINPNFELEVKAIKNETNCFSFKKTVLLKNFSLLESELNDCLVFKDVLVTINQTLLAPIYVINKKYSHYEEDSYYYLNGFVMQKCSYEEEFKMQTLPDFKFPKIIESYEIVYQKSFINKFSTIQSFDILKDDPELWIKKLNLTMIKIRADPEKYGRQVLAFLLKKQNARWLNEQIEQDPSINWESLSQSFVNFIQEKQTKETVISSLPDSSNDSLEEQIENKMRLWKKQIASISNNELRMLVYKSFPNNSIESFVSEYQKCSNDQFVRFLRLKYENQLGKNKLNAEHGIEILNKMSIKKHNLNIFHENQDDSNLWINKFELILNKTHVDSIANRTNVLAFMLDDYALDWLIKLCNNNTNLEWTVVKNNFIDFFTKYQLNQKNDLFSNYKKGDDVREFVLNKLKLWKTMLSSPTEQELHTILANYFDEPKRSLIQKFVYMQEEAFVVACQLAFNDYY